MQLHLIRRAAEIIVDKIRDAGEVLQNCNLVAYDDYVKNGFISICALRGNRVVASVSQCAYSLQCGTQEEDIKKAQSALIKKINQVWSNE